MTLQGMKVVRGWRVDRLHESTWRRCMSGVGERLAHVVREESFGQLNRDDMARQWLEFHADKPFLSAVVPGTTFKVLQPRWAQNATFVLPLPRDQGFEMYVMQYQPPRAGTAPALAFTSLAAVQAAGGNLARASPRMAVSYFDDYLARLDHVLLRGRILEEGSDLDLRAAQTLVNLMQIWYLDDLKYNHVVTFNTQPDQFDYQILLQ